MNNNHQTTVEASCAAYAADSKRISRISRSRENCLQMPSENRKEQVLRYYDKYITRDILQPREIGNCIVDKTETGNGATYGLMLNCRDGFKHETIRNLIITEPSVATVENKAAQAREMGLQVVEIRCGTSSPKQIIDQLYSIDRDKPICVITTLESVHKFINAIGEHENFKPKGSEPTKQFLKTFWLVIDEWHKFLTTKDYRNLEQYFNKELVTKVNQLTLISATPVPIHESLYFREFIDITSSMELVKLINRDHGSIPMKFTKLKFDSVVTQNIANLIEKYNDSGRFLIHIDKVSTIIRVINELNMSDVSAVHCSARNMKRIKDAGIANKTTDKTRFIFITSAAEEGVDLLNEKNVCAIYYNISKRGTAQQVKQFFGRNRGENKYNIFATKPLARKTIYDIRNDLPFLSWSLEEIEHINSCVNTVEWFISETMNFSKILDTFSDLGIAPEVEDINGKVFDTKPFSLKTADYSEMIEQYFDSIGTTDLHGFNCDLSSSDIKLIKLAKRWNISKEQALGLKNRSELREKAKNVKYLHVTSFEQNEAEMLLSTYRTFKGINAKTDDVLEHMNKFKGIPLNYQEMVGLFDKNDIRYNIYRGKTGNLMKIYAFGYAHDGLEEKGGGVKNYNFSKENTKKSVLHQFNLTLSQPTVTPSFVDTDNSYAVKVGKAGKFNKASSSKDNREFDYVNTPNWYTEPNKTFMQAAHLDDLVAINSMVFESDDLSVEKQMEIAERMSHLTYSVVHSGNKSIHVRLVFDQNFTREEFNQIWDYVNDEYYAGAADKMMRNPIQMTRHAGFIRDDDKAHGVEQTLLSYNQIVCHFDDDKLELIRENIAKKEAKKARLRELEAQKRKLYEGTGNEDKKLEHALQTPEFAAIYNCEGDSKGIRMDYIAKFVPKAKWVGMTLEQAQERVYAWATSGNMSENNITRFWNKLD